MAVDRAAIGADLPSTTMTIDASRLRFFAKAIGETNPVYFDLDAAKQAGHRNLLVPPTFLFGVELERPDPFGWLIDLGVDLRRMLHGEQSFVYHSAAYAVDTVVARPRIVDIFTKKGGSLSFIVKQTEIVRDQSPVADLTTVIVVRDLEEASK